MKNKWAVLTSMLFAVPTFAQTITPIATETELSKAQVAALACPAVRLSGVNIGRGALSNDFDIRNAAGKVGEVDYSSDRYEYKLGGLTAAKAAISGSVAVVTDCGGAVIGTVEEAAGDESSSFVIKDAAGNVVARSGRVDDYTFALQGAGGAATMQEDHGFLGTGWTLSVSGVDDRLVATASLMNHTAIMRRASERNRERMMDRPHGRHDI